MKNLIELDFSPLNKFQALAANKKSITETINHLSTKDKVLLVCTSNRWEGDKYETPKSTQLANYVKSNLKNSSILDISKLHIEICEGNARLFGKSSSNFLGNSWKNIIHPDDRERVELHWSESVRDKIDAEDIFRALSNDKIIKIRMIANKIESGYIGSVQVLED